MTTQPFEAAASAERRHQLRKKFSGTIEIDWGSTVINASVLDIGPRGLFIEMSLPLWVGAAFGARLLLNPVLALNCVVARVEPQRGIAVVFEVVEASGKAQLEALLASLSGT
jgi:hypothetical protein